MNMTSLTWLDANCRMTIVGPEQAIRAVYGLLLKCSWVEDIRVYAVQTGCRLDPDDDWKVMRADSET